MVTKRGLSDIVSNVLIILLVLVAVGILWLFLRPTITKAGNVGGAADCYGVDVSVVSCTPAGTVVVQRGAGGPKLLKELKIVLDTATGTSAVASNASASPQLPAPAELQTVTYNIALPGQTITYASVAGVIMAGENGTVCQASQKIVCK